MKGRTSRAYPRSCPRLKRSRSISRILWASLLFWNRDVLCHPSRCVKSQMKTLVAFLEDLWIVCDLYLILCWPMYGLYFWGCSWIEFMLYRLLVVLYLKFGDPTSRIPYGRTNEESMFSMFAIWFIGWFLLTMNDCFEYFYRRTLF